LIDIETLRKYREALQQWKCDGYIVWLRVPSEWLRQNIDGENEQTVAKLMFDYFDGGGEIDRAIERRDPWRDRYDYHYDFRFRINGRPIYIETVLDVTGTGPTITIVSMHDE
jgi:hypothetical protein